MNDDCPLCGQTFVQGAKAMLIGHVTAEREAELRWAHIACLVRNTLGDQTADAWLDQWP